MGGNGWIYEYPIHYLYDVLVMLMMVLMGRQFFNLNMTRKQVISFVLFMMVFYQINFLYVEPVYDKGPKYLVLYLGLFLAYKLIAKLNWVSAMLVILTTSVFNGIWTNVNVMFMLTFFYDNYGIALDHKHEQYTFYFITVMIMAGLTLMSRFKIVDIQKYN